MTATAKAVAALDGVVGSLPGGGERREGQREMASLVAEVIDSKGHAVVQAGTGTGKSLAYLVPALLSGKRTVIATATKALQDQLASKDLPFVAKQLGVKVDCAVLKGRSNYLCRQRLDEALGKTPLAVEELPWDEGGFGKPSRRVLDAVALFSERSISGDRSELRFDMSDMAWRSFSVTRSECPGAGRCPQGRNCFAEQARARAARAKVVIVNHHLYALSLVFPGIIDDHDLVVIDEAHQLEEAVSSALGRWIAPARFTVLARSGRTLRADREACTAIDETKDLLHDRLKPLAGRRLRDPGELMDTLTVAAGRISHLVESLRARFGGDASQSETPPTAQRTLMSAQALLDDVNALRVPDDNDIVWVDGSTAVPALRTTPLRIDELLAESLWSQRAAVLTSATIPPAMRESLGLPDSAATADVGSPFDYKNNALLYCPRGLPGPGGIDRTGRRLDELEALITAARGRTLALYTSYSAMHAAAEAIRDRIPWPVLTQGTKPKAALMEEFASDEHSCLFATLSFWQGVDVPGRSCSLVVIDKLPFPRPDDPVLEARRELAGPNAFRAIDLPRTATLLTQGAGRLIRTAQDRGVVAVLDPRLATRNYRHTLTGALPPMRRSIKRHEAIDYLHAATADESS